MLDRRRHAPSLLLTTLALLTVPIAIACDPDELAGQVTPKPDPAKAEADAAAQRVAQAEQARKDAADAFAVCMAGCIEGQAQSPTDRQSCRLTCGADRLEPGGPGPSPSTKAALARWQTCTDDGCRGSGSATDAATCRLNCAQTALAGDAAPTLRGPARGCAVSCLEELGDCETACTGDADAVATCRLQCTSLGERCLGVCEADPSATPTIPATAPEPPASAAADEAKVSVPKATRDRLPTPP